MKSKTGSNEESPSSAQAKEKWLDDRAMSHAERLLASAAWDAALESVKLHSMEPTIVYIPGPPGIQGERGPPGECPTAGAVELMIRKTAPWNKIEAFEQENRSLRYGFMGLVLLEIMRGAFAIWNKIH